MTQLTDRPVKAQHPVPSIALVRGEALNPFEMQAYGPLIDQFVLRAVGRRNPRYDVNSLPMPVTLLHSIAAHRAAHAIQRRMPVPMIRRLDPDMLARLHHAVGDCQILHAAETVLPVSEQCARIARRNGAKLVLTCWETIPFRYDDDPTLARRKELVKEQADHYIAVTERACQALVAEGVAPSRVSVIPAAVDCDRFAPASPDPLLRERWNLSTDALVVLYVGRMIQEKGVVELVRAFAVSDRPDNAMLVLVGNGNQAGRVRVAARLLGIEDRVRVLPGVGYHELPAHYATADVVAAPSLTTPYWEEQFGMVLAETLASGRPLITTRSGAIPEVVGQAARLVEPYDVGDLSGALGDLLNDANLRAEFGEAGRAHALTRYAVPVVAKQLERCYTAVAGLS